MAPRRRKKNDDVLRPLGLNKPQRTACRTMSGILLGSAEDCALLLDKKPSNLGQPLRALANFRLDAQDEAGLLESHVMGATKPRAARYWLGERGRALVNPPQYWHGEFLRSQLLQRLPLVEQFYPVLAEFQDRLGRLRDARWSQSQSHDMIARFEKGWVAFFYSGVLETRQHLLKRLDTFNEELCDTITIPHYLEYGGGIIAPELAEYTQVNRPRAYPSMIVIVVPDLWQVELVRRALRERTRRPVQIRCIATGQTYGDPEPGPSEDDVLQPIRIRDMGGWPWPDRLKSSLWADNHVPRAFDLLYQGLQWPGITPEFARVLLGLSDGSQEAHRSLRLLQREELLGSTGGGRAGLNYWLNGSALDVLCKLDNIGFGDIHGTVQNLHETRVLPIHDAELMETMCKFAALGAHVAPGYREYHEFAGGSIAPDAMVYLSKSPYGPGWHYKEHERTARNAYKAKKKLKGYASKQRRNRWPVMFALWNDEAEGIFQRLAAEWGVPLLTTTMERLQSGIPIQDCWSDFGMPTRLGFEGVHVAGLLNLR